MMSDSPLVMLLVGYSALGLAGLASSLVGASLYDLKEAKIHHEFSRHPYTKQNRRKPLIAVLVYADSKQNSITDCLQSIKNNSYRKYEIIVIDDSRDNWAIKTTVTKFSIQYPKTTVHILQRRKKTTRSNAIQAGINKFARTSDLVICINASTQLHKDALRNAGRHFNTVEKLAVLVPNSQTVTYPSILGIYQQFDQIMRMSSQKLLSLMGAAGSSVCLPSGTMYRHRLSTNEAATAIKYASDVLIYNRPAVSWLSLLKQLYSQKIQTVHTKSALARKSNTDRRKTITRFVAFLYAAFLPLMSILTPIVITLLLYLAIYFKQTALYGLSWVIFSAVLLGLVWANDSINMRRKLGLVLLIPLMYSMFYIGSLLHLVLLAISSIEISLTSRIDKLLLSRNRHLLKINDSV